MTHKMDPIDGCTAAAHIAYYFSDNSIIYPITPSSPMAEVIDSWAAQGRINAFGQVVRVDEMNHEAGAIGAMHGALLTGSLTTTFTASQGLLLMIPNLYKMAGEHLPAVLHVAARTIATHALAIHGDHSDIMACRQTGISILISPDVQEAMDFSICAHIASLNAMHPVIHAFDGFRTSHTIKKVEVIDYARLAPFVPHEKVAEFRRMALSPDHPTCFGSCQGPPVWLQAAEADNTHYSKIGSKYIEAFKVVEQITGRRYEIMDYIGAPDATDVIVLMGSGCVTARETIEHLVKQGKKVGAILIYLYRPFEMEFFISKIPTTCRRLCVLDRCKEPGAAGEPLRLDVVSTLVETGRINSIEKVIGGRFGQASKDFIPADVESIFENLVAAKSIDHFICSINDDVTHKSLPRKNLLTLVPEGTKQCMFFGQGSDGTVGANKNAIKIIADNTPLFAQGYFDYDSFKAGGLTTSHLRFGPKKIGCEYYVYESDFTAVSQQSYWNKYHEMLVENCREGSILLLNTSCKTSDELNVCMPQSMRTLIAKKKLQVKLMDASAIAAAVGLPGRINSSIQTAFFLLSGVLPEQEAITIWKKTIEKTFKKKGQKVIDMNIAQVDETIKDGQILSLKYPDNWGQAPDGEDVKYFNSIMAKATAGAPDFIHKVFMPTALGQGEKLPVSAFTIRGSQMTGTTRFYKRAIATSVPIWDSTTCIQCMQCVIVCPHAVIRPYLLDSAEAAKMPADIQTLDCKNPVAKKYGEFKLVLQASPLDCTGCAVCVKSCPMAKDKGTLKMVPVNTVEKSEYKKWTALSDGVTQKANNFTLDERTQAFYFRTPYFEYNGACAGCGETAYISNLCRLFGHRMIIANATGCSSIYGFSFPYNPYSVNEKGQGPAWANSLFEDNAEFGFGMVCSINQRRDKLKQIIKETLTKEGTPENLKAAFSKWLDDADKLEESESSGEAVKAILKSMKCSDCETMKYFLAPETQELFPRPIIYIQGGDGWAYDIGYGGLDHIMASGLDFTLMVLDTEVYSNTGGQKSKATPMGAVARFAAAGKTTDKKDLALICMSYRDVYVASINLAANYAHAVKSMREAVEHHGPSLLIAYCPCMEHGQDMSETSDAQKLAGQTGYWLSFTRRPGQGVQLVTPKPSKPVSEFLNKQTRFKQLVTAKPQEAAVLSQKLQEFIDYRFANYSQMAANSKKE